MKRACVSTSRQLSKHCARKAELRFDDQMHHVVRDTLIVTRRWIHFYIGK
jgi:hypothetical protein